MLVGERVGRAWVIDHNRVRSLGEDRRSVGRPWSASSAWGVLAMADGEEPVLSPVERSRAKKRLANGLDKAVGRARRSSMVSIWWRAQSSRDT